MSRLIARLLPITARRLNWQQLRNLTTEAKPVSEEVPAVKKRKLWPKVLLGFTGLSLGVYTLDLYVNDDFEIITDKFRKKLPPEERQNRPRVVILGSGWAALNMLRKLHTDKFNVTVVSPRNYFLFTPLLPSTTSGTVEVRSIMEPVRYYCKRSDAEEATFLELEATKIDTQRQVVHCTDVSAIKGTVSEIELPYDFLVMAVGAETATFNIPGVPENAVYMKSVEDTTKIRNRIMDCFETAVIPGQPEEEVERLLHFVVVGGGPSGVEYTAELHDFVERDLKKVFPTVAPKVKITLVEALDHVLNVFDARIIDYVENKFRKTPSINLMLKSAVVGVEPGHLKIKKEGEILDIPYGTLVWVTGNSPRKIVSDMIAQLGPSNQPIRRALSVDEHLLVKGTNNIFAIGDCAVDKQNNPQTAQVASQQGRYLGRLFNEYADQLHETRSAAVLAQHEPFKYNHFAKFAYVGDWKAVGEFKNISATKGFMTFLVWRSECRLRQRWYSSSGDAKPSIPSVDNTLSAVRLRRSFDDLAKKLQFTSMEDFYTLDSAKVVEHFGSNIIHRKYRSVAAAVMAAYPEHQWLPWKFDRCPRGFWRDMAQLPHYVRWLEEKLNIKQLSDWYNVSAQDVIKVGGARLLTNFQDSLVRMLARAYPQHKWEIWKFKLKPRGFWRAPQNRRRFFDWLYESHFKLSSMDDWYNVTEEQVIDAGGATLMVNYFNNSMHRALTTVYPEHDWQPWRFPRLPPNYWRKIENRRKFFDALAAHLKLQSMDDWYNVSFEEVREFGGEAIIKKVYQSSVPMALMDTYTDHTWLPWRFSRFPRALVQNYPGSKYTVTNSKLLDKDQLAQLIVTHIAESLSIQSLEDWYKVSYYHLKQLGLQTLVLRLGGLTALLRRVHPDHEFDEARMRSKKSSNIGGELISQYTKQLLPISGTIPFTTPQLYSTLYGDSGEKES